MAEKRPIALYAGELQELLGTDTLPMGGLLGSDLNVNGHDLWASASTYITLDDSTTLFATAGVLNLQSGSNVFVGPANKTGIGSTATIQAGRSTDSTGGTASFKGGQGATYGGFVSILGGSGATAGGNVTIDGGFGSAGDGGDVTISGGDTITATKIGGDLTLRPGYGSTDGKIFIGSSTAGEAKAATLAFLEDWSGTNFVGLKAPGTLTADVIWTLPSDTHANADGKFLTSDASGNLSFAAAGGGVGGSTTELQFNNAGVLDGTSSLTYNDTNGKLSIAGTTGIYGTEINHSYIYGNGRALMVTSSASGSGNVAIYGQNTTSGQAIRARALGVSTIGVYTEANGSSGSAIRAFNSATTGNAYGIDVSSSSSAGTALRAYNWGGGASGNARAIQALVDGGVAWALYAENSYGTDTEVYLAGGDDLIIGSIDGAEKFKVTGPGAVTGLSFNGVALTTGGAANVFLNGAGSYVDAGATRRNILFNTDFAVNQRSYTSGSSLAGGAYGYDRWRGHNSTAGSTHSLSGGVVTIDHTTASTNGYLAQPLEAGTLEAGKSYTVSWEGTAQVAVWEADSQLGTLHTSPYTFTAVSAAETLWWEGDNVTVSKMKLELGTTATPWEKPDPSTELSRCQRYYYATKNVDNTPMTRYSLASGAGYLTLWFPTTMRATPSFSQIGTWTATSGFAGAPNHYVASTTHATISSTASAVANGTVYLRGSGGELRYNAEL